ncbi:unnamed protein product [Lactuca saligna]|uniref:RRM domain-containing protein n=1 Tax=Lactuca saligna TaxID=75948 RepID=A0AA36DXY3_LACSI|nr:unnamed protein product [Lactuca saligna]
MDGDYLTSILGGNKTKAGNFFGFIRFIGVEDAKVLESKLNGTKCRKNTLEINIAKHVRKIPSKPHNNETAMALATDSLITVHMPSDLERWIKKSTLIGEARSMNHLDHMPTLISIHSEHCPKVKYAGGLMARISFNSTVSAGNFLSQENNGKHIFKWLKWGDTEVTKFERVAWVRIVGLPLKLWNESNFKAILAKYGKIVAPCDKIQDRMDLSVAKLSILTSEKRKLNEIVNAEVDGKPFTVGVVEYEDEPWFPFKFDDEEEPYESQSDVNSSSDEDYDGEDDKEYSDGAKSDADMKENEVEEGEIVAEEFDDEDDKEYTLTLLLVGAQTILG